MREHEFCIVAFFEASGCLRQRDFEALAARHEDAFQFGVWTFRGEREAMKVFHVRIFPSYIVFANHREKKRAAGSVTMEAVEEMMIQTWSTQPPPPQEDMMETEIEDCGPTEDISVHVVSENCSDDMEEHSPPEPREDPICIEPLKEVSPNESQAPPEDLELGYIVFEDCRDVVLPADTSKGEWVDVQVIEAAEQNVSSEESHECCPPPVQTSTTGQLYVNYGELDIHGNAREINCQQCNMQRPDIVILLGLLHASRPIVKLKSLRLSTNGTSTHFVATLSFPALLKNRSLVSTTKGPKKPLPSSLQTLLMIIESDWEQLQRQMESLLDPRRVRKNPLSYFPKQLTISELYQRLETTSELPAISPKDGQLNHLVGLPPEVWTRTLGTFLNASEVANLRNSCRTLKHRLRDVVPGLRLQLFPHQVRSLDWMRQREQRALAENEVLKESSNRHRSITGGLTVFLQSSDGLFSIRINATTGEEYLAHEDKSSIARDVARGGMLCDDPGLGKTITVLALILQTSGFQHRSGPTATQAPETAHSDGNRPIHDSDQRSDDAIFYAYWSQEVTSGFRVGDYLKLVNGYCRQIASIPFPIREVRATISSTNGYGSEFQCFDNGVRSSIITSAANSPDLADHLIQVWDETITAFKRSQMRSVRRHFSSVASKPNSQVATLIDKEKKEKLYRSLVPSSSTLLVVPAVLLDHWQSQIKQHTNWRYSTNRKPLTFVFTARTTAKELSKLKYRISNELEYAPLLFLDKGGTVDLPDAKVLAQFQLVITTTNRFKNEWKKGSFQREIQQKELGGGTGYNFREAGARVTGTSCELLKVHWKRMIVDEGHSMGNKASSTIQFSSWIQASRRWVMTGTPTKHGGAELGQLSGLLKFLGHQFFTPTSNGDVHWKRMIAKEWQEGSYSSFFRLSSLLRCLMKRHTKLDFDLLTPPEYETTRVQMSSTEVATYNTLVSGVQSNILLTSMASKTSGFQDSLLSRNQATNARQALSNIRRVCTGCTRVVPFLSNQSYRLTLDMAEKLGLSQDERAKVKKYIHCVESEGQPECGVCAFRVPTQILMSCCGGISKRPKYTTSIFPHLLFV